MKPVVINTQFWRNSMDFVLIISKNFSPVLIIESGLTSPEQVHFSCIILNMLIIMVLYLTWYSFCGFVLLQPAVKLNNVTCVKNIFNSSTTINALPMSTLTKFDTYLAWATFKINFSELNYFEHHLGDR